MMTRDEEISYLTQLLALPAWDEFLVKHLQSWKENDTNTLTAVRKDASPPDDFLRGRIDVYNFFLFGLRRQLNTWLEDQNPSLREDVDSPPVGDPYGDPGPTPGER